MIEYLNYSGLSHFFDKLKALFAKKTQSIKNISRNGTTFTATRADGSTFTFDQQTPGTATSAAAGLMPPLNQDSTKYLDGTGNWTTPAGDLSNDFISNVIDSSDLYPVPAVGDSMKVILGKVVKFFSDIRAAVNAKIDTSKISTSLAVTATGSVADATVSKVLNDKITTLNDSLPNLSVKRIALTSAQDNSRRTGLGFVYNGGESLYLLIPLTLNSNISSINITKLLLSFRKPSGGFVIADNADVTSYINIASVSAQGIYVNLLKPDGFGVATNVPLCGQVSITCTFA